MVLYHDNREVANTILYLINEGSAKRSIPALEWHDLLLERIKYTDMINNFGTYLHRDYLNLFIY